MREQPKMHFEPKGWGWERWIVNKEEYCGKLLYIAKDRRMSFHYHKLKDETFYLQSGEVTVYFSDDIEWLESIVTQREEWKLSPKENMHTLGGLCEHVTLRPGDNFHVPPGRVHSIWARRDSELFEFSTQHFENDSYRIVKGD